MLHTPNQLKKFFLLSSFAAVAICLSTLTTPASAETVYDGFYIGAVGGLAFTSSYSNPDIAGIGVLSGTVDYSRPFQSSTPYTVGGNVGYKYGPARFEAEGFYMKSDYEGFSPAPDNIINITDFNGGAKVYGGLANVYYNFDQSGNSGYIYLGLGGGYAVVKETLDTEDISVSASTSGFAMQAIVGYAYNISSSTSFDIDYRYFTTFTNSAFSGSRFQNHLLNIGFNYFFG